MNILDELVAKGVAGDVIVAVAQLIADAKLTQDRRAKNAERMKAVRTHAPTSMHTETQQSACVSKKKKVRKVRHTLPENWTLSENDRAYARTKGWADDRIDAEGERFRLYYLGKGVLLADEHLTWCKWVISPYQNGAGNGALHTRSSGQQKRNTLAEAFAEIRSELGSRSGGPPDVLLPHERLPKPKGISADGVQHSGGIPTGDRGIRHRSEDRNSAPVEMAPDASGNSRGMRGRDRLASEDCHELKVVAGTEIAAADGVRRYR